MPIIPEGKALFFLCRLAVGLLSVVLVFGTAVPLLRSDAWWIRVFDFPRIQIAVLIGLTLAGYAALHLYGQLRPWEYALAAVVGLGLVWQLYSIAPYTTFYPSRTLAMNKKLTRPSTKGSPKTDRAKKGLMYANRIVLSV